MIQFVTSALDLAIQIVLPVLQMPSLTQTPVCTLALLITSPTLPPEIARVSPSLIDLVCDSSCD